MKDILKSFPGIKIIFFLIGLTLILICTNVLTIIHPIFKINIPNEFTRILLICFGATLLLVSLFLIFKEDVLTAKEKGEEQSSKSAEASGSNSTLAFTSKNFPESIEETIEDQLYSRKFYKESVIFLVNVDEILTEGIQMTTELSYYVQNRTNEKQNWAMEIKFKNHDGEAIEAKFDDLPINPKAKEFQTERGVSISQLMKPKQRSKVYFKIREKFHSKDSEIYTSYFPAKDLKLVVNNVFKNISFDFEVLYYPPNITSKRKGHCEEIIFEKGILPFQGVRLNWEIKN